MVTKQDNFLQKNNYIKQSIEDFIKISNKQFNIELNSQDYIVKYEYARLIGNYKYISIFLMYMEIILSEKKQLLLQKVRVLFEDPSNDFLNSLTKYKQVIIDKDKNEIKSSVKFLKNWIDKILIQNEEQEGENVDQLYVQVNKQEFASGISFFIRGILLKKCQFDGNQQQLLLNYKKNQEFNSEFYEKLANIFGVTIERIIQKGNTIMEANIDKPINIQISINIVFLEIKGYLFFLKQKKFKNNENNIQQQISKQKLEYYDIKQEELKQEKIKIPNLQKNQSQDQDLYQNCDCCKKQVLKQSLNENAKCGHKCCFDCNYEQKKNLKKCIVQNCQKKENSDIYQLQLCDNCKKQKIKQYLFENSKCGHMCCSDCKQKLYQQDCVVQNCLAIQKPAKIIDPNMIECDICFKVISKMEVFKNQVCKHNYCKLCVHKKGLQEDCYVKRCYQKIDTDLMEDFFLQCDLRKLEEGNVKYFNVTCHSCNTEDKLQVPDNSTPDYYKCQKCLKGGCIKHQQLLELCLCFCPKCFKPPLSQDSLKICKNCKISFCTKCSQYKQNIVNCDCDSVCLFCQAKECQCIKTYCGVCLSDFGDTQFLNQFDKCKHMICSYCKLLQIQNDKTKCKFC